MISRRFQPLWLCLLVVISQFTSCSLLKKKKDQEPAGGPVGQATLIGMIEMVNPEQNYVVIRSDAPPSLPAGTELLSLSAEGKKSKLVLSPERKGFYLTADIQEGNPMVSDLVLLPRESLEPKADTPPPPTTPPAGPEPVTPALPSMPAPSPPPPPAPATVPVPMPSPAAPSAPAGKPASPLNLDDLEPPVGNP
jgi:hypothetical protein